MTDPQETIPGVDADALTPAALAAPEGDLSDLGYRVSLDQFSGPMDLLLYLVKRTELDIVDIPLATITDQFVATVTGWHAMDLEVAGDFIVMAATLLEIKARMLAPPPPAGEEGEPQEEDEPLDPRADLIRRLMQYRRFKDAALLIDDLQDVRQRQGLRQLRESIPEDPGAADDITLEDLDVHQLFRAYEYQMARISGLGPRRVVMDEVSMDVRMGKVVETLQAERLTTLKKLLTAEPSLVGQAGVLIATLEVVRQRFAESTQLEQYGQVDLRFRDEAERAVVPTQPPEEPEEPGRRRKRIPLVTYRAPDATGEDDVTLDEPEERVESEEQRFLRELDASCDLSNVMAKAADIEGAFIAHWQQAHPGELPPTIAVERVLQIKAAEEEKRLAEEKEAKRKAAEEIRAAKRHASWESRKDQILGGRARREAAEREAAQQREAEGNREAEVKRDGEPEPAAERGAPGPLSEAAPVMETAPAVEPLPVPAEASAQSPAAPDADLEVRAPAGGAAGAATGEAPPAAERGAPGPLSEAAPVVETAPAVEPLAVPAEASAQSPAAPDADLEAAPAAERGAPGPLSEAAPVVETAPAVEPLPVPAEASAQSPAAPDADLEARAPAEGVDPEVRVPAEPVLSAEAEAILAAFDEQQRQAEGEVERKAEEPDADAGGRRRPADDEDASEDPDRVNAALLAGSTREDEEEDDEEEPAVAPAHVEPVAVAAPTIADPAEPVAAPAPDEAEDDEDFDGADPAVVDAALLAGSPPSEDDEDELIAGDPGLPHLDHAPVSPASVFDLAAMRQMFSDAADTSDADDAAIQPSEDEPVVRRAALTTGMAAAIGAEEPGGEPVSPPPVVADPLPAVIHGGAASVFDDEVPEGALQLSGGDDTDAAADRLAMRLGIDDQDDDPVSPPAPPEGAVAATPGEAPAPLHDAEPISAPAPEGSAVRRGVLVADAAAVREEDEEFPPASAPPTPLASVSSPQPDETAVHRSTRVNDAAAAIDGSEADGGIADGDDDESAPTAIAIPKAAPLPAPVPASAAPADEPPAPRVAMPVASAAPATPIAPVLPPAAIVVPAASAPRSVEPITEPEAAPVAMTVRPAAAAPQRPAASAAPPPPTPPPSPSPPPPVPIVPPLPSANRPSTPNPERSAPAPMPAPPTRNRAWLIAATLALVNALGWVGYCWLVRVPRDLLEVVAAPVAEADQPWVWRFNLDAVTAEGVGSAPLEVPRIEPEVAGRWEWRDQRTLVFTPAAALPPAFTALVRMESDHLRGPFGFHLAQDLSTLLRTSPARATAAETVGIAPDGTTTVDVAFDRPVEPARVAERVRVEAGGAKVPATALSRERSDRVRLAVGPAVEHDGKPAQVRFAPVDAGPARSDGPLRLDPQWRGDVTLGHALRATAASAEAPTRGGTAIHIRINDPAAPRDVLVSQVRVEPDVPFAALPSGDGLRLEGDFVPGATYTVRFAAAWPAASDAGVPVKAYPAAAELAVTIPARQPGLWFADAERGRIALSGVNLGTVLLRVHDGEGGIRLSRALDLNGAADAAVARDFDADLLLAGLPTGRYRVVAEATDQEGTVRSAELNATVRDASVDPERLASALLVWAAERLAGHGGAARVPVAALGL